MEEKQKLCGHKFHENSHQETVCLYCGVGIDEYQKSETERLRIFYPYRIEFNTNINIDPGDFDLKNIGTLKECKRIINIYFPNAIIGELFDGANSREILNENKIIGYIIGNVFRY